MVMSNLAPTHPAEEALGGIGVDFIIAAQAVGLVVIDPVQCVSAIKLIPGAGGICVQDRPLRHLPADEVQRLGLVAEYTGKSLAVLAALADHNNHFALAGTVLPEPPIAPVLSLVGWLHVAAKKSAVDFRFLAFAADR